MGELHVNMNITLDGVIQANGGPTQALGPRGKLEPASPARLRVGHEDRGAGCHYPPSSFTAASAARASNACS